MAYSTRVLVSYCIQPWPPVAAPSSDLRAVMATATRAFGLIAPHAVIARAFTKDWRPQQHNEPTMRAQVRKDVVLFLKATGVPTLVATAKGAPLQ